MTHSPDGGARLRIATLYRLEPLDQIPEDRAAVLWWKRISFGLAERGHRVDIVSGTSAPERDLAPRLRNIPCTAAWWLDYDAILTFFHRGFDSLADFGGADHPAIICNLGSVVGARDETPGVYFFGQHRQWLYSVQQQMARRAFAVNILTEPSRALFLLEHRSAARIVSIPQGVDRTIPAPRCSPFGEFREKVVVLIGSIYGDLQKEMNRVWQDRLNSVGRELRRAGMRLCWIGPGDRERLDTSAVTALGPVEHDLAWNFQYHAAAGLVLAQGAVQHNESTKLYNYLRGGLPVVSETPVPNNNILEEAQLGFIVPFGDDRALADALAEASGRQWNRRAAMEYMVAAHSWDRRVHACEKLCLDAIGC